MIPLTWQLSLYRLTTIKWLYIQERIHGDYKSGHYYNVVKNNDQYILNDLTPEADFSDLDISDLINASSKLNASFLSGTVPLSAIPSLSSDYIKTFSGTNDMIPKITNNGKTLANGYGITSGTTLQNRNTHIPTEGAVLAAVSGKLPTYSDATSGHVMLSVAGGTSVRASEISIRSTADQPIGNAPTNLLTENVIYEALKTAGIPQLATASEASSFATSDNLGKAFLYTGTDTADLTRGHVYLVKESQASIMAASTITWNSDQASNGDTTGTFYKLGSDYVTTYNGNTYPIYSSNSNPGSGSRIILKTSDGYDLKLNGLGSAPSSYLKNVSAANSTYSYLVTKKYFDIAHGTGSVSTTEGKIQSEDFNALSLSEGAWVRNSTPMNVTVTDSEAVTSCVLVDITSSADLTQYYTKTEVDSAITSATNGKQNTITSSNKLSYDLLSGVPDLSSVGKDSLQITVPSVTQSVKFVLETSTTGASSSWTTRISYSQTVQLEFMNPSRGNLTTNPSNSISTNYSGMTMIVKPSQMGNPTAGTYYRYQFITGTSTSDEKWVLGVFGSSSNGDFKTIQSRLSTIESSSGASVGSTIPANLAATASAGSSSQAARADHVHSTSGLVTIDSSSLSAVISIAIVSGSLPSTVSNNVLYFVLGGDSSGEGGSSTQTGPYLEITGMTTTGYANEAYNGKYYLIDSTTANTVNSLWKHESQDYTIGKYTPDNVSSRLHQWAIYSTQSAAETGTTSLLGIGGSASTSAESNFGSSHPVGGGGYILYHAE